MTIIVVEQFAEFALDVAEHAAVMTGGRIVHEGPAGEVGQRLHDLYLGAQHNGNGSEPAGSTPSDLDGLTDRLALMKELDDELGLGIQHSSVFLRRPVAVVLGNGTNDRLQSLALRLDRIRHQDEERSGNERGHGSQHDRDAR